MASDPPNTVASSDGRRIWRMFDRIARRYDLLNRLLSFGRDVAWRKRMARYLPSGNALRVLDLATGTADVLLTVQRESGRVAWGVGADPSEGMLRVGQHKILRRKDSSLHLVLADATQLAIAQESFDAVTMAFGIRNVSGTGAALREMARVLAPGGRAIILEFSLPANRLFRAVYLFYFRHVLPRIGGLISGDYHAYQYLNQTVESFPYGAAFCALMEEAGLTAVTAHPLTFGIATIYVGEKPKPNRD